MTFCQSLQECNYQFAFKYSAKISGKRKQVAYHPLVKTVVSAQVN